MASNREEWKVKAAKGKAVLDDSVPKQWLLPEDKLPPSHQTCVIDIPKTSGALSEEELLITETTATDLARKISANELTAEKVTIAFLKRATIGHQLTNFATEFMVDEAIARAKELDQIFKATGKVVGPLHGVPMTVKEHIGIKGRICNAGYVAWMDNIAPEDALVVTLCKNAGAVFLARTNEPQSLMHMDSCNNITGATLNPYNLNLSPGGSSGGEGASIGFKAAAIGIGTDIGGSIRGPAAFCGTYGYRPTTQRTPMKGLFAAGTGQESIRAALGPLANTLEDCELFMKAVLDQNPWEEDIGLVPVPWRSITAPAKMTIGIMRDDGVVRPHPPILRALKEAEDKLSKAGINIVEWEPYEHGEMWELAKTLYWADGAEAARAPLTASGEPLLPLTEVAFGYAKKLDVGTNWKYNARRDELRSKYHQLMKERGVDYILCPPYVGVAPELMKVSYWLYTAVWNVLDLPSVILPTGLCVDPTLDKIETAYKARNELDAQEYAKYSPEKFKDAPITLQLVGGYFQDEKLFAGAKIVDQILHS